MLDYAVKLTVTHSSVSAEDIKRPSVHAEFDDRDILDHCLRHLPLELK